MFKRAVRAEQRPVPSRPGFFATADGHIVGKTGLLLHPSTSDNGYYFVNGGNVNRLVCEAFHGPPPTPKHQAAHWDGDRKNNKPENLRWATRRENYQDQIRHGTHRRGAQHHMAKLTDDDVRTIRSLRGKETQKVTAARYGIRDTAVSRIQTGKRWPHL